MIQIDDKIISDNIIDRKFVCDLSKCKGACCIHGDSGAPFEESEILILEQVYNEIVPYMRAEGIKAVEEQGKYVVDVEYDKVTPLVNGGECAYVVFDADGIALCAIEKAFLDKKISFRKPISCYLYPIRTKVYHQYEAINYDVWDICKPAIKNGELLNVSVYKFLKEPIIQKYGEEWFEKLKYFDENYKRKNTK